MTATEKLRHLLDKRGIEWGNIKDDGSESDYLTGWQVDGNRVVATEWPVSGGLTVEVIRHHLTPEQAIEATLGLETCRNISNPPSGFLCSECGWGDFAEPSHLLTTAKFTDSDGGPNYCPNCGAKVVSE